MHEHYNDMPGDIAGGDAENLPGGFGTSNPDASVEATIDELIDNDVNDPLRQGFSRTDNRGGDTSGTDYAEAVDTGSTVEPSHLLEGNEAHPGAMVGFTGEEDEKYAPPEASAPPARNLPAESGTHGGTDEVVGTQQAENMSIETEGPTGGQRSAGSIPPPKKAA